MSLKEYLQKLYWDDRLTQKEIGKIYNKSRNWVYRLMNEYNILNRRTVDIKTRFLYYVKFPENPNDCWEWIGDKDEDWYGHFKFNGKIVQAHRVSYLLFIGNFDQTLCCLHKCDNPSCVNPNHLFLGTPKDNARDRVQKGRNGNLKGEKHGMSKLTEEEVKKIKTLLSQGIPGVEIARSFEVSAQTISNIKRGRKWKHIRGGL